MFNAFILSILFSFGAGPFSPGVVFEIETTYHKSGKVSHTTMAVEGKLLKMEIDATENNKESGEMLFNGSKKELTVVDHDGKNYFVIDEEFKASMAKRLNDTQSEIMEALEGLPKEQRDMILEAQKKNGMGLPGMPEPLGKYRVNKTSESASKNGYPCVKYIVLKNDKKFQTLWVTDWDNIKGGAEAKAGFTEMYAFFSETMESLTAGGGVGEGPFANMKEMFERFNLEDGFPVLTKEFDKKGKVISETNLKAANLRTLYPADFEPPSDYKRRSMMGGRY